MLPDPDMLRDAARQAAACAQRLRLPLRSRVWQGPAGELAGVGSGSSMDFQDHRPYFPGDDPRHINWQAYARTGQYTMKLYREEVRPAVDVLFDGSASMFLTKDKALLSAGLLHFVVECARRAGAEPAVHAWDGGRMRRLELQTVVALRWPEELSGQTDATPGAMPDLRPLRMRANGLRVLISDLLYPGDPAVMLRALGQGHGSALVLCPFAPEEAAPDWAGACEFRDVESDLRDNRQVDAHMMRRYRAAYDAHFLTWKEQARRFRTPMARVPATGSLESTLGAAGLPAGVVETCAS